LKCYLSQDWPDKELVVIDDGAVKVGGVFLASPMQQAGI
jgi:hypothetical protein